MPFAPFGMGTVSRTLQPQLMEYLYALSASDGADPTRAADTGADPTRNGEPEGELGLVKQKDHDWQDQTGAPGDPQPGNISGGKRDVLRSAASSNGNAGANSMVADSGIMEVQDDALTFTLETIGDDPGADDLISVNLDTGDSQVPVSGDDAPSLVVMDMSNLTDSVEEPVLVSNNGKSQKSWHTDFLVNKGKEDENPFEPTDDFIIMLG